MTPFRVVLLGVLLLLLAGLCIPYLSVDYLPAQGGQSFTISFRYPNRPPLVLEQEVTRLLENHLSQLEGIQHIRSVSSYGGGYIELEIDPLADISWMETYLSSSIRQVHPSLPAGCSIPLLTRRSQEDPSKSPLLIYELTYTQPDKAANQWLSATLIPMLSAISSIDRIETRGNRSFAWYVHWNPAQVQALKLDVATIQKQLTSFFKREELGLLKTQSEALAIYYAETPKQPEDLLDISIQPGIRLGDIATVTEAPDRIYNYQRINGQNAIFINMYAMEGINRMDAADQIQAQLAAWQNRMPAGYQLMLNYDDTEFLKRELDKTWTRALLSIVVIGLMILLSYRSWRYLLILSASIGVSMALTLLLMWGLDITIHLYSIAGITISLGILVDNAIILADHIRKQPAQHHNLSGVLPAQGAAALSTISALLVVLILPREYREDLTDFGWVISLALVCSLLVSWWFTPALYDLLQPKRTHKTKKTSSKKNLRRLQFYRLLMATLIKRRKWIIALTVLAFGLPVFLLPSRWEGKSWYNTTIGSDTYQEDFRPVVNRLLGGSLRLFYQDVYEKSAYRTPERTQLYLNARLPYGHTLTQMNDIMRPAERYLLQFEGIDKFITRVSSGQYASIVISFTDSSEDSGFPFQLKNRLIQQSLDWAGVTWSVYGVGKGFSNATGGKLPGFKVIMKGYNYDALEQHAQLLAFKLLKHRRIQTVNTNSQLSWNEEPVTQYRYRPSALSTDLGVLQGSYQHLQNYSQQMYPSLRLSLDEGSRPVYIASKQAAQFSLQDALHPGNDLSPLTSLGNLRKEESLTALHKEDRQYLRSVAFDYYGSYRFGKKYLDEQLTELQQELPPGYTAEVKEWSWGNAEEKQKYGLLLVLLLMLFFISTIFLESIRQAFLITAMIPLCYIGLFLIFSWGGFSFDQGGYAAFLMVGGLSINAMYFILAYYRQHLGRRNRFEAMTKAIWIKAWPITMTVVSTCAGLLPFLIHGDGEVFWFAFAIGTIGGMLFSLVISFFLLPVMLLERQEIEVN